MKKLYALLLGTALFGQTYAKTVDVNSAKQTGYSFLTKTTNVPLANGVADLQTVYTATADVNGTSTVCFYIFNTPAHGFVIVSADDNVIPILGYSDESAFQTTNMPDNLSWWMNNYTQQIGYVIAHNIAAKSETVAQWRSLASQSGNMSNLAKTTNVSPLLGSLMWDQIPYYNELCPGAGTGNASVTGCVATAMAQVMKFWNWPANGAGAHSYTPTTNPSYGVQSVNFGSVAYQWSSMPNQLTASSSTAAKTAVATLMYDCGVSVNMDYTSTGSGAPVELVQSYGQTTCAETSLKTYFKYKKTLHGDARSSYSTTTDWENALKADLDAGRPVLYTGYGASDGHCWVADGYTVSTPSTLFHFNWGWSGQSNGNFTVDNLAPPALGTGGGNGNFNNYQAAIFGIEPDRSVAAATGNMKLNSAINIPNSPQNYYQTFTISTIVENTTGAAFSGDFTAELFDRNGSLVTTLPAVTKSFANNTSSGTLTFTPTTENIFLLTPDIYSVRIYYRNTGGSWTLVGDNGTTYVNYTTLEISDDGGLELVDSLTGTNNRVLFTGQPVNISTYVYNLSSTDYNGTVAAGLFDPATQQSVFTIQIEPGTTLTSGNTSQLNFSSSTNLNIAPGTYVLIAGTIDSSNSLSLFGSTFFQDPILVQVAYNVGLNNIEQHSYVKVYPNPAAGSVNIDLTNINASSIRVVDLQGRTVQQLTPGTGIMNIPVSGLTPGIYIVQIQTDKEVLTQKITVAK